MGVVLHENSEDSLTSAGNYALAEALAILQAQHPEGKQSLLNEGENAVEHALNRRVEIVLSVSTQADDVIVIDKVDTNIAADPTLHPDLQLEK